nr:flagellar basal body rod protein FlgF [Pseudomonas corrugata]
MSSTAVGGKRPARRGTRVDKYLYVAMTGASQNALAQRAHANNLANISTNGFQKDLEQARSMPVFGDSFPARAFAMSERPATDFTPGALVETGRDLDVAVSGPGWMAVQNPDGGESYVRTGSLNVDALGVLRAGNGMPVMGNGGPIAVPPEQKIEIGQDGTISIRAMGEGPRVMAEVDRIKLVNPDLKNMTKGLDGSIRTKDGQSAPVDANVQLVSGFQEASNVNAVDEMTSVLALAKQFELHVKMMNTAKEGDEAMARVLQI